MSNIEIDPHRSWLGRDGDSRRPGGQPPPEIRRH